MNPQEAMMTLYALPCELPALDAAVVSYIHLVEATVLPSAARADVIDKLHSFQQRYQGPLRSTHSPQANLHSNQSAQLIPLQATSFELMAFGSAVLGYMRLLEMTVSPTERMEVMAHLCRFQKR